MIDFLPDILSVYQIAKVYTCILGPSKNFLKDQLTIKYKFIAMNRDCTYYGVKSSGYLETIKMFTVISKVTRKPYTCMGI